MYFGSVRQSAQRWHWGNAAPNSHSSVGDPHFEARTIWTAQQQMELHRAAETLLKSHEVASDTTIYWLAMELIDTIASIRDGQLKTQGSSK